MDKTKGAILAQKIKNGDISSFEKVFRMYYPKLLCFVNKIVLSKEVAKDITQDVFVKFWINRSNINPEYSCIGLLYAMSKNAALDYLRSKLSSFIPLAGNVFEQDEEDVTEERYDTDEIQKKLKESLSKLPAQQQKVFILGKVEHMSNKEIAQTLDISVRTVEKHMELAKKKLKMNLS